MRRLKARRRIGVGEAALKGAVAGVAGAIAMLAAGELEARGATGALGGRVREIVGGPRTRGSRRRQRPAAPSRQAATDLVAQLSAAAAVGAVFGIVQSRFRLPEAAHGALLGGLAYAASASGAFRGAGLLAPPPNASLRDVLMPAGTHAVFGLTTARAYDMLTGGKLW